MGSPSDQDDPPTSRPRIIEKLYVADPDIDSATALITVEQELLAILPDLLEDQAIVARMKARGVHARTVRLAVAVIASWQRRQHLAAQPAGIEVDEAPAQRDRMFKGEA